MCKCDHFTFECIDLDCVEKELENLNIRKATGWDDILPKILNMTRSVTSRPVAVTYLFHMTVTLSVFSDICKRANICPLFKKDDALVKKNYKPVSILTSFI